ncbi:MAG TPA: hypothetical protein VI755_11560 [Anaerolineales bacterium]|nr:hypothetical protein [Anaerolineales bacterium]
MIPDRFEQITWDDWDRSYWIETISTYAPLLFIRAYTPPGTIDNPRRAPEKNKGYMTTPYIRGEDAFVYVQIRNGITGQISLEPIYTLKGA